VFRKERPWCTLLLDINIELMVTMSGKAKCMKGTCNTAAISIYK